MLNNKFKLFITVILTLIISLPSFAQGNNSGQREIKQYKIDDSRIVIYTKFTTKFVDKADCKGNNELSTDAVAISTERDNFAELYASVMLAHAHNKQIGFWLDGFCTPSEAGGPFPTAKMVYVY